MWRRCEALVLGSLCWLGDKGGTPLLQGLPLGRGRDAFATALRGPALAFVAALIGIAPSPAVPCRVTHAARVIVLMPRSWATYARVRPVCWSRRTASSLNASS